MFSSDNGLNSVENFSAENCFVHLFWPTSFFGRKKMNKSFPTEKLFGRFLFFVRKICRTKKFLTNFFSTKNNFGRTFFDSKAFRPKKKKKKKKKQKKSTEHFFDQKKLSVDKLFGRNFFRAKISPSVSRKAAAKGGPGVQVFAWSFVTCACLFSMIIFDVGFPRFVKSLALFFGGHNWPQTTCSSPYRSYHHQSPWTPRSEISSFSGRGIKVHQPQPKWLLSNVIECSEILPTSHRLSQPEIPS